VWRGCYTRVLFGANLARTFYYHQSIKKTPIQDKPGTRMNMKDSTTVAPLRHSTRELVEAIRHGTAVDNLPLDLTDAQWTVLAEHMQAMTLPEGEVLFEQALKDRNIYLVESGSLTVHCQDQRGRIRMAVVTAGSVLGEGAFFSSLPRKATVQASVTSRLWRITPVRFRDLSARHPDIALALSMAMGTVLAHRLYNKVKKVAVT